MFEVGFTEILLIAVLGLIVLGPEKLPRVASQLGRWMGRARSMARQFREQLEDEVTIVETQKARPASRESEPGAQPTGTGHTDQHAGETADRPTGEAGAGTIHPPGQGTEHDPGPPMYTGDSTPMPPEVAAAEHAHSENTHAPAPEPEAPAYEPPAYAKADAGSPREAAVASPPSPSQADDEPPRKSGDFITTTHERGI